jgi:hypothetical protein
MLVDLRARLGLHGTRIRLNSLLLDAGSVGNISSWAGSYHVLSMGRHYEQYVVTPRSLLLPPILNFPISHPYQRCAGKIKAPSVTGNIGEAVAALFARRCLTLHISDITHIRPNQPFRQRKAPDYLMRMKQYLPGDLQGIWPQGVSTGPEWWPVESKARNSSSSTAQGVKEAFKQLAAYWHTIHASQPNSAGYGMVVSLRYNFPREVLVTLFLPRDQNSLLGRLRTTEYQEYVSEVEDDPMTIGALYGA